jgi:hypothetical protein
MSQVERYKKIFAGIAGFQALIDDKRKINAIDGKHDSREDLFNDSLELMQAIIDVFPSFRDLSLAFHCEPEEEHLHRGFITVLSHAIRFESPLFDRLLALAYKELVVDQETLFDRYAMNRLAKSAFASGDFVHMQKKDNPREPKLFDEAGEFLHDPLHFVKFFNVTLEYEFENSFRHDPPRFIATLDKLLLTGCPEAEQHKSNFQAQGIADHLWPDDLRHVFLFQNTQITELMSEHLRKVIDDIHGSSNISFVLSKLNPEKKPGYKENLIRSFMALVDTAPADAKDSLPAMFAHHINFYENNDDLNFALSDHVLPGAYLIQQLSERGVDFCDCLRLGFSEWKDLSRADILQAVATRLPNYPKTQYLKNHEVWFGALIEACDSDELRSIQLSSEQWLNLYRFKGETWMRDRVTQGQHLHSALEIDLGL